MTPVLKYYMELNSTCYVGGLNDFELGAKYDEYFGIHGKNY